MKKIFLSVAFVFVSFGMATSFDLEMSGSEYLSYFESESFKARADRASAEVEAVLSIGKRNLEWFKLVNSARPQDQQLALYTPELQNGIPIESPKAYNEKTVLADYQGFLAAAPVAYKSVVLGTGPLSVDHVFESDAEYLEWTRKMDKVYQSASRWKIMQPYLWSLESRSYKDIRGYFFLNKETQLETEFSSWESLSEEKRKQYKEWLILLCHNNSIAKAECERRVDLAITDRLVWNFYSQYNPGARKVFDSFFNLQNPRSDVEWSTETPLMTLIPFLKPESLEVQKWLSDNIEDEWKWNDWKLKLNFLENGMGLTHVVFAPGATPNVNGLGGNRITMDANAPLQDYGSRWTIRHEYGHVLGLPDCYIEFYDSKTELIINYQIDLTNLMCSRKGKLQEKHYLELKKHYFR